MLNFWIFPNKKQSLETIKFQSLLLLLLILHIKPIILYIAELIMKQKQNRYLLRQKNRIQIDPLPSYFEKNRIVLFDQELKKNPFPDKYEYVIKVPSFCYYSIYKQITYHKEASEFHPPSSLLISFLKRTYQKLSDQLEKEIENEEELKKRVYSEIFEEKDITEGSQLMDSVLRGNAKTNDECIQNFFKEWSMRDDVSKEELDEYKNFMERNLSSIQVVPAKMREKHIGKMIKRLSGFLYLEKFEENGEISVITNMYDRHYHFPFQEQEQKILKKQGNQYSIGTLDDLITTFKIKKQQMPPEQFEDLKNHLYQKLLRHLTWELLHFQFGTEEEGISLDYPFLNPSNILFDAAKEFFFLDVEPILFRHLLGFNMITPTPESFFTVKRKMKFEKIFMAPEERVPLKEAENKLYRDTNVFRMFLILATFEKLEYPVTIPGQDKFNTYRMRKLDNSPECRAYFGERTHEHMMRAKGKAEFLSLANLNEGFSQKFQENFSIEWLFNQYWLKAKCAKELVKMLQKEKYNLSDSEKTKANMYLIRIIYYALLNILICKKQADYSFAAPYKWVVFEQLDKLQLSIQLKDRAKEVNEITKVIDSEKGGRKIKSLGKQMAEIFSKKIYTEEYKIKDYGKAVLNIPDWRYQELYESGSFFFEEKQLFQLSQKQCLYFKLLSPSQKLYHPRRFSQLREIVKELESAQTKQECKNIERRINEIES